MKMVIIQNYIKKSLLGVICITFFSCGGSEDGTSNQKGLRKLAKRFYSELTFKQRLDALLLLADNDTAKICYALVMPKQTFERLSKEETFPTSLAITKTQNLYVNSVMSHCEYLDSLCKKDEEKKDWLIHNSINEPINPIWEQIMEGKK